MIGMFPYIIVDEKKVVHTDLLKKPCHDWVPYGKAAVVGMKVCFDQGDRWLLGPKLDQDA